MLSNDAKARRDDRASDDSNTRQVMEPYIVAVTRGNDGAAHSNINHVLNVADVESMPGGPDPIDGKR